MNIRALRDRWRAQPVVFAGVATAIVALVAVVAVLVAPGAPRLVAPADDAGEELFAGLSAPAGTRLAGPIYEVPSETDGPPQAVRQVLLVVLNDPIGVWDRLVDDARSNGVRLTGSASSCTGYDTLHLPSTTLTGMPDHPQLECWSRASAPDSRMVDARLMWGASSRYLLLTTAPQGRGDFVPAPPGTDAKVPEGSRGRLPAVFRAPTPSVGEVFGPSTTCFGDASYHRLRIPAGSRLIADARYLGDSSTAMLAAEDPEAAINALGGQLAAHHEPGLSAPPVEVRPTALSDGTSVPTLTYAVPGNDGVCRMWATPDNRHVVVTTRSG